MIFIIFVGYVFLIKPKFDMIKSGGILDIKAYQDILLQEKRYLTQVKNLAQDYKKLDKTKLEKLSYVIADKLDISGLLFIFESLNTQHGITPTNFTYSSDKGVTKVNISFTGKDYYEFKNYLKTLEDSVRLMDINKIQMSIRDSNYSIELSTYYLEGGDQVQVAQPAQPAVQTPLPKSEEELEF